MRLLPDPTGRFKKRPFFETVELDVECETLVSRFLRDLYGKVEFPLSTNDLTKLIERHVDDLDGYADLATLYGEGVEGVTEFARGRKPTVRINVSLANNPNRENRLRTTLAHEFGHVHFHAWLFEDIAADMFSKQNDKAVQVCKRETIVDAPMVDWLEWQAGHVCGAILMPGSKVRAMAKDLVTTNPPPALELVTTNGTFGSTLIQRIADRFLVSSEAARVRLLRLGILNSP